MSRAKMPAVTLVKAWLEHYTKEGMPKQAALTALNKAIGTRYQHGHLSRWERGERGPSSEAREEMMRVVLKDEHPDWTPRQIATLLEKLK